MGFFSKIFSNPIFKIVAMAALAFAAPALLPVLMQAVGPALGPLLANLTGSGLTGAFGSLMSQLGLSGVLSNAGAGTILQFLSKASTTMQLLQMGTQLVGSVTQGLNSLPSSTNDKARKEAEETARRNSSLMVANRLEELLKTNSVNTSDFEAVKKAINADPNASQLAVSLGMSVDDLATLVVESAPKNQQIITVPDDKLANLGLGLQNVSIDSIQGQLQTIVNELPGNAQAESNYRDASAAAPVVVEGSKPGEGVLGGPTDANVVANVKAANTGTPA